MLFFSLQNEFLANPVRFGSDHGKFVDRLIIDANNQSSKCLGCGPIGFAFVAANSKVVDLAHVLVHGDDLDLVTKLSDLHRQPCRGRTRRVDLEIQLLQAALDLPILACKLIALSLSRVEIVEEGLEPFGGSGDIVAGPVHVRLRVDRHYQQQAHGHHSQQEPLTHQNRLHR